MDILMPGICIDCESEEHVSVDANRCPRCIDKAAELILEKPKRHLMDGNAHRLGAVQMTELPDTGCTRYPNHPKCLACPIPEKCYCDMTAKEQNVYKAGRELVPVAA